LSNSARAKQRRSKRKHLNKHERGQLEGRGTVNSKLAKENNSLLQRGIDKGMGMLRGEKK